MYSNGDGVKQDYGKATNWIRKAADQRHVDAQYNLGVMYLKGAGVSKDLAEAVKWLRIPETDPFYDVNFGAVPYRYVGDLVADLAPLYYY
jgi:hypothetical protein